ncbi:hypothetical protein, partial [Chitinophaga alhagiae]|uniref:Ig-like domain-containing protein n=1 Tax=Chitinophaga alhagiae TaxID=2203219 RepID=UPI0013002D74
MPGFTNITGQTLTASPLSITLPAGVEEGTYTFTLTLRDAVGCESIQPFTVIIEEPSSAPTIAVPSVNICVGNSATLTVTGTLGTGAEWVWYTGSCNGTEVDRGASISVTPTVTTTYYVKAVSSGPCGNTVCATVTVNVYEDPSTADAGADQEHCDDDQFSLAAANPTVGTGLWSGTLPAGASISSWSDRNASVTLPAGQTVTLTWTVTNGPCTASTDQVTLTNLVALSNNTISASQSICPNTTPAQLTGTTPAGGNSTYTYQWQSSASNDPATFTNIGGATGANYAPGTLTTTTYYRRIVTSGECSSTSNIIAVTVSVTPVFTVQNVAAICNTETAFDLSYAITAGTPDEYDIRATGANPMPGFTNITGQTLAASPLSVNLPAGTPAGTYNFTLTLRDAVGCESTQPFTVTIEEPSTAPTIAVPSIDICVGNSASLTVSGTLGTGAEWVWYTGSCNGTEVDRGASISVTPTVTTTYYVKAVSSGPCGNTVCATVTVNVYEDPSTADAGADQEHCDDDQFSLAAANPTVGTGLWSGTLPAGASISSWSDRNASVTLPAGQTVTLTWTVTNGPCTASTDQVTLTNLVALSNNTISASQSICPNTTPAQLTGTTPAGGSGTYTYQWQSSASNDPATFTNIGGATGASYAPGALTTTTYYRRIVTSGECSSTSNIIAVTVSVTPVFTVQNVAAVCNTETAFDLSYAITAGTPDEYDIRAAGANPMPGFTNITGQTLAASPLSITLPAGVEEGTYTFTLTLRDAVGCESTQPFTVTIEEPSTTPTIAVPSINICVGNSATLTVSGTLGTGAEWVWYTGSCNGTEVDRGASISVTPTVTTTYYVKAVSSGPCGNTVCATVTVNVYEDPSTADAGNNQEHCDDDQFSLAAANPTVGTGLWSGTLPAGASISSWSDRNASVTLPAGQ